MMWGVDRQPELSGKEYDSIVPGDWPSHTNAADPVPLQQTVSLPPPEILRDKIRQHPE